MGPAVEEEGGTNWDSGMEIHTRPRVKQAAGGKLLRSPGSSAQCSVMTSGWAGGGGGWEAQERGDICILMTES